MIAAVVAVYLLLVVGSALDEASGESSPCLVPVSTAAASSGVVVLLGGVVGMLPAWSLSSR
jgi:ABC-type antimicrobial peptide transport system permease subunit